MNIILIIFDTLRRDCIGAYGSPPWGKAHTPHFDAFAGDAVLMTGAYPESLPTLQARRSIYTGMRVYPFHDGIYRLKGDFIGAPGWGPIPENLHTIAELLSAAGYRTGLVADLYHLFKPSKNYARGFDQWSFIRGQELDSFRSGPSATGEHIRMHMPQRIFYGCLAGTGVAG